MPSDLAYWLISAPLKDGDPKVMLDEVERSLGAGSVVGGWEIPELKVGRALCLVWSCKGLASFPEDVREMRRSRGRRNPLGRA